MPRTSTRKVTKKTTKKAVKKTTKKVTKKTTKKAVKKTVATKESKRPLVCADGAQCFWVHDGPILKDLTELAAALNEMSRSAFSHHTSNGRNDFAEWVEYVLCDVECAAALRKAKSPAASEKIVIRQLRYYA